MVDIRRHQQVRQGLREVKIVKLYKDRDQLPNEGSEVQGHLIIKIIDSNQYFVMECEVAE